jgi:hypothetical protein
MLPMPNAARNTRPKSREVLGIAPPLVACPMLFQAFRLRSLKALSRFNDLALKCFAIVQLPPGDHCLNTNVAAQRPAQGELAIRPITNFECKRVRIEARWINL